MVEYILILLIKFFFGNLQNSPMTDISSHYPVPDTSRFLFEKCYSSKDMKAKKNLTMLTEIYKAIVEVDPSSKVAEHLRNQMDKRIEEIALIKANRGIVLKDVLRGHKQTSLETAQTHQGEGSF